jgi:type I restriction enzyme S subunit
VPAGWETTVLGEVLPIEYGKGLPSKKRSVDGNIPVFGSNGHVGFHSEALTSTETLIVGRKGAAGVVHYSPTGCWPIDTAYYTTGSGVELKYFFHLLRYLRLDSLDKSTAIPSLSRDDYNAQEIPLAPLNEQRRIVAKIEELFSDLDAGVAALERIKANLKRYHAAVLKAAVEGRLTEEWRAKHPKTEPASKLLERILAEHRQQWEEDQLARFAAADKTPPKGWREKYVEPAAPDHATVPELPQGWCWATVQRCAIEVTVGHVGPMKDRYISDGIPFLRSQNVRPLRYDRDGLRFIPDEFHEELKKSKLFGGELLVVRSGNIGDACVYPDDEPEANCADLVITRLVKEVNPWYAATFVVSPLGQALVGGKRTGSALSHFNVGAMAKCPFPLPSVAEQAQIVSTVAERLSQIEATEIVIEHGLKRAARLRQSVLKRAFEGRLVPQDPTDEPAAQLLDRIRQARGTANGGVSPRTRRGRASTQQVEGETHGAGS